MRETILEVLANIMGCEINDLKEDLKLREIEGFDSLQFVMAISELQEKYSIEIPLDKAIEVETIGELIACAQKTS